LCLFKHTVEGFLGKSPEKYALPSVGALPNTCLPRLVVKDAERPAQQRGREKVRDLCARAALRSVSQ